MMITIRRADSKDVKSLVKLWEEFMKDHDEIVLKQNPKLKPLLKPLTVRKKNAAENMKRFFQKNIRSKNGMVHIADVNGKPIGYSLIYIKKNIPVYRIEKMGYISDLFIKKEYRTRGLGSIFKNEAIKWFRKKGVKYISIAVHSENKLAYSVYKKWGFFDYHIELRRKI